MRTQARQPVTTPPRRSERRTVLVFPVAAAIIGAALAGFYLPHARQPSGRAADAARAFLKRYVDPNGRVIRGDQGGDTVSEGQSYAMLLAAGVHDRAAFDAVWSWTKHNLMQRDGSIAWHWQQGRVVDTQSASDADLDAARALLVASSAFRSPTYGADARRLAGVILRTEALSYRGGVTIAAGPWAVRQRFVNPSYLAPRTFAELASATHDVRWRAVARSSSVLMDTITRGGQLPPDWVQIDANGHTTPVGPAGPSSYGAEAPRALLRFAEACDAPDRAMVARVRAGADAAATGDPVTIIGAAAADAAAGDRAAADAALDRAASVAAARPTYYGSALVALGRMMLTSDALGGCPS